MELNRVLITGGAGFLGSHLVDRLIDTHEVVVLDVLSTGSMDNLAIHVDNKRFTFIEGRISSEAIVKEAIEGSKQLVQSWTYLDNSIVGFI